jgi:hypothetical protein
MALPTVTLTSLQGGGTTAVTLRPTLVGAVANPFGRKSVPVELYDLDTGVFVGTGYADANGNYNVTPIADLVEVIPHAHLAALLLCGQHGL